uniref:Ig-like domain-containing protein n=1 Tax=Oreochromis niloticus TaxID=8128 RepID=A0A669BNX4_ORENI
MTWECTTVTFSTTPWLHRMEELLCLLVFIAPLSCAATPVRLTMSPNYLQYFKERRFTLNCEGRDGSADWNVIMTLPWDTGVYWCESKNGQTSEMQNLTVTAGSVILQTGVALPITEGDDLTLVCVTKKPTKNWSAFYKDGALISSVPTGRLTIRNVAKSDEGVYNCETERDGKSPSSWIAVTETIRGEFVSEGPLLESTSPETTTGGFVLGSHFHNCHVVYLSYRGSPCYTGRTMEHGHYGNSPLGSKASCPECTEACHCCPYNSNTYTGPDHATGRTEQRISCSTGPLGSKASPET